MNPVRQEDGLGCAVACVAFVLNLSYKDAVNLFTNGKERVKKKANFYCPEIVSVLKNTGMTYKWKKVIDTHDKEIYKNFSIVFIQDGKYGHFLCRYNNTWMDPWVNRPYRPISAQFITDLPVSPTYVIYKI